MVEWGMPVRVGRYDSLEDSGVLDNTMEPKQDLDRRSINDYLNRLHSEQEGLKQIISKLEERLTDVLGPERPPKSTEGEQSPEQSPMARWLDDMVYRQEQLSVRLAGLIDRVEL